MLFNYKAVDRVGGQKEGSVDSLSIDGAIANLQKQDLVIVEIKPAISAPLPTKGIKSLFGRVKMKDVVILSQQLSTLVGANVPILTTFRLVASETENPLLGAKLAEIVDDIQGGTAISAALARHPDVFSAFYVSLVRASEESGKLPETFKFLAEYLDRSYRLISKAKNALVYPIFVVVVFGLVMILMLVLVIPQLTGILLESGQSIPLFTRVIIGTSDFFVHYGVLLLFLVIVLFIILWQYSRTAAGKYGLDRFKLSLPYLGQLYRKMFLSRVADNLNMMLESGIPVIRSIEVTADVVGNEVYRKVMLDVSDTVKGGGSLSEAFAAHGEFPGIMAQMARIGEETGKLDYVLKTLSRFYTQEVESAIDLVVSLIEPVLIVVLGLGVATLLAGILLPIYSLTGAI